MGSTNHSKKNTTRHPLKSTKMAPPTMEKPQQAQQSDQEETGSNNSVEEVPRKEKKTKKKSKKSKKSSALDQLPTGGVTDGVGETADNALSSVSNTLGSVGGQALNKQQGGDEEESGGGGKSDTLRLRLDLNLDVEIQLKARIHGDLELALLTG